LFENVLDRGRQYNRSHFLMGTTEDTLDILRESIQNRYPGTNIVGSYAPEFGPLNTAFLDLAEEAISPTEADIVWVALGSPKQDFAARELADRLNCTCIGVGAAFDFLAGTTKEAPTWMRKNGFEWLFRLASEPRRLWKRYLIGNLTFLRLVALQSLREKKPPSQDQRR
jgi:N-acetylglucosaminyldiphosphoundecaprenol N-acetyl-beta-D-mannosaminyltransferase